MPVCQKCGQAVGANDRFCSQCGAPVPQEIHLPMSTHSGPPQGWIEFRCRERTFTMHRPPDWQPLDPPASEGAGLSCAGPGGFKLLEAFSYRRSGYIPSGAPYLAAIVADGLAETLGQEEGHANAHVRRRDQVDFPGADYGLRMVVSYTDRGLETTSDYLIVGDRGRAVMLALKVLSADYESILPLYQQVIGSLKLA